MKILYIEDDPTYFKPTIAELEKARHQVVHFSQGNAAINYLHSFEQPEKPELIVSDFYVQSAMSGKDLVLSLVDSAKAIPIVFASDSAYFPLEIIAELRPNANPLDYHAIQKPYTATDLINLYKEIQKDKIAPLTKSDFLKAVQSDTPVSLVDLFFRYD